MQMKIVYFMRNKECHADKHGNKNSINIKNKWILWYWLKNN